MLEINGVVISTVGSANAAVEEAQGAEVLALSLERVFRAPSEQLPSVFPRLFSLS